LHCLTCLSTTKLEALWVISCFSLLSLAPTKNLALRNTNNVCWKKYVIFLNRLFKNKVLILIVTFFVVLGFDLRVLCLLGRCTASWTTSPVLCALVIFQVGSCRFLLRPESSPTDASHVVGMTGVHQHYYWLSLLLLIEIGGGLTSFLPWLTSSLNPPDFCLCSSWNWGLLSNYFELIFGFTGTCKDSINKTHFPFTLFLPFLL
jgi:hypothetical protein